MYFSQDGIKNLAEGYATLNERAEALILAFARYNFTSARAREFANHGFARRVQMLAHCIENVFVFLPPEEDVIPTMDTCTDATVYIQAFLFNVFGALDNLAWIWIEEKGITDRKGRAIPDGHVGLGRNNRDVRSSFSKEFRNYLSEHHAWFKHLGDFRHALAHRIPLYIPRYVLSADNTAAYNKIQRRMDASKVVEEYERLSAEQMKLVRFHPWMVHSFSEKSPKVVFHPQMLSDFAMIDEIGRKMLDELAKPRDERPRWAFFAWVRSLFSKD